MTAVGVTAAVLFHQHHDEMTVYYGIVIMTAGVGALAARNSGSPPIVFGQAIGTCMTARRHLPVLLRYRWYWGLTSILLLYFVFVKSTDEIPARQSRSGAAQRA